ncbi:MAG: GNAT family N-acetyltransferase [Myxococcota bacterium]|nr:GNAT family N-acetyltransferase [Myxococcota bacterium]
MRTEEARLPATIRTRRLRLRPWSREDADDVLVYAADETWSRFLPVPRPYTEADARRFVDRQMALDPRRHPCWAIEHGSRAVGGVDLRLLEEGRIGEMGYALARPLWGRGLATEAARAVVGAAFEALPDLVRVRANADARNAASLRVLEKLGMRREGVLRANRFVRGEPVDEVWLGVLRDEWEGVG